MFAHPRTVAVLTRVQRRSFALSSRPADMARLTLIGRLGRDPLVKTTSNDKEYVLYTVATRNSPPPPNEDGTRRDATTSWHSILSFSPSTNNYLKTLKKGSHVYVEASYELKDADPSADPDSPAAQRQIFLRHELVKVLSRPPVVEAPAGGAPAGGAL